MRSGAGQLGRGGVVLAMCLPLLAGCAPPRAATMPSGPGILAVVAWNLDAGRGDLPRLVADLEAGRLTGAPASHVLLLLQEVVESTPHDPREIARVRGWSAFFAPVRALGIRTIGNAILSSAPLLDPQRIALPQERQPRAAAVASILIGGQSLFVVSVHLENRVSWWKGGPLSDTSRGRQARALLGALPSDRPGILGGDLNTWLGSQESAWRALAQRFDDTPPEPKPTFRDRLVLDHLFFDLPMGWRAARLVLRDRYGSDHHPVVGLLTADGRPR